jgi:hypothetical protein
MTEQVIQLLRSIPCTAEPELTFQFLGSHARRGESLFLLTITRLAVFLIVISVKFAVRRFHAHDGHAQVPFRHREDTVRHKKRRKANYFCLKQEKLCCTRSNPDSVFVAGLELHHDD